jgi:hypothetical protein
MLGQALCSTCGEVVNKSPWTWVAEGSLLSLCSGVVPLGRGGVLFMAFFKAGRLSQPIFLPT